METTTIFRLEHPVLKCGPWNTHVHDDFYDLPLGLRDALEIARRALNDHFDNVPEYSMQHPSACADVAGFTLSHQCAAPSIELLKKWFAVNEHTMLMLERAGFTVIELVVKRLRVLPSKTGTQVGYHPDNVVSSRDIGFVALKG